MWKNTEQKLLRLCNKVYNKYSIFGRYRDINFIFAKEIPAYQLLKRTYCTLLTCLNIIQKLIAILYNTTVLLPA